MNNFHICICNHGQAHGIHTIEDLVHPGVDQGRVITHHGKPDLSPLMAVVQPGFCCGCVESILNPGHNGSDNAAFGLQRMHIKQAQPDPTASHYHDRV